MPQYSGERSKSAARFGSWTNATASTLVPTVDDSGTSYRLNRAAGIAVTLPAIASADDVGTRFRFFTETTFTGNLTITAGAGDLLYGSLEMVDTDSSNATTTYRPDASDDLIITCNGTTTGGLVGTDIWVEAFSTAGWLVWGENMHSSNVATPFS